MEEIWKDIQGYEDLYQVSNLGRVKSLNYRNTGKEQILKPVKHKDGYLQVILCKNGKMKTFYLHRLVAQVFIPNKENFGDVNHKNEIKTDNRVENLEWCTRLYNNNYGTRNERVSKSKKGRKQSEEWIEKRVKALKGRFKNKKLSQETIEKMSIPIVQLDLEGNYIATHQSVTQVGRDLGFYSSNINACCKGRYKTAHGYKWCYLSEWEKRKAS